jgi:AAA+ superfamily predicted ATPase
MKDTPGWASDCYITVHDDDDSPFEGVVELLRRCIGFGLDNAQGWARHIDRNGSAKMGPWTPAIARSIHEEMMRLAPQYHCRNLRVIVEEASEPAPAEKRQVRKAHHVLGELFDGWSADSLVIVKREFPAYLRVDVQTALDALTIGARRVGIHARNRYDASDMAALISERDHAKLIGALQFEDIDTGEDLPIRLATNCLSLIEDAKVPLAVWVNQSSDYGQNVQLSVEILAPPGEEAAARTSAMIAAIEAAVAQGRSYRGKVLSLEGSETYRGTAANALTVHFRTPVEEHELILPDVVKRALDRHVIRFAAERDALKALGQSGRKGVLLYGPPGTGKTHTIRYLAERLQDHTTFLVTAEQIGMIAVYFRLARLFAPSIIVIEDADLIARQREDMHSACDEVMLNRLLNEMDGLRFDADIFVIMTTNRPHVLEAALIQRPGRIDHAIEVPVPDTVCRERLLRLYGGALVIDDKAFETLIARTEGVSAAFIKEVARRLVQQSIAAGHPGRVDASDLEAVLEEMLSERDGLNLRLLGGNAGGD